MGLRTKWKPGDDFLVRHKDAHIVVVEKKAGMLTHAGPEQDERSLLSSLRHFLGPRAQVRGVHRLDRVVSGLLVFARTERAYDSLVQQFAEHTVDRHYLAGVATAPEPPEATVEAWLDTEPMDVKVVDEEFEGARRAITHYRVLETLPGGALLEVRLETGCRNQIRVHLAHLGHPLLGERKYHPERPRAQGHERIFLHAAELGFNHPLTRGKLHFEAAPPPDLRRWMAALRKGAASVCPKPAAATGRHGKRSPKRRR